MIKRIELWDFESHEHTVLEDISPALNLLCGESNSGKTSIVRALKLVAYNEFDPKSIRLGAKKCSVQVDTERGKIKVTRGPKDNLWEITRNGGTTQYFDKVGVNIVPEAAEIFGLHLITLGDVQIPVNIMDQHESHFMLAGVGDKDATGSMRAQIVDEISGLSGIEGLIKDVSLDRHRFGREITETEKSMEATRSQLHPEDKLNAEAAILSDAERELADHQTMLNLFAEGKQMIERFTAMTGQRDVLNVRMADIPDTKSALQHLNTTGDKVKLVIPAIQLYAECTITVDSVARRNKKLSEMPDVKESAQQVDKASKLAQTLIKMQEEFNDWASASCRVNTGQDRLEIINQAVLASGETQKAKDVLKRVVDAEKALLDSQRLASSILGLSRRVSTKDDELSLAMKDRDSLILSIKICPLNLRPVSKECLT